MKKVLPLLLTLLASLSLFAQTIYYVKPTGSDTNNGTSWATAFKTLQKAINTISTGQIWVAAGTYYPDEGGGQADNNQAAYFTLKAAVALYGGFPATGTPGLAERNPAAYPTILSGDIDKDGTQLNNSFKVLLSNTENNTAVLDGFTITGANGDSGIWIYLGSSPSIANCIFTRNKADVGGAMCIGSAAGSSGTSPTITNCIFIGNTADYGGAIFINDAHPTIINCTFTRDTASYNGGGAIWGSAPFNTTPRIINCISWNNVGGEIIQKTEMHYNVSYSIVQGGYSGTGNLNADPLFVNAADQDLHLKPCSPAIDHGSNTANYMPTDLDGHPRITHNTIDMGAYEFQPDGRLTVLYVNTMATGLNNGMSWTDAYTSLQDALNKAVACLDTKQVWVAAGTYYPDEGAGLTNNDRTASFILRNNVAIYGGFAGTETELTQRNWKTNTTILGGAIDGGTDNTGNSYHVVRSSDVDASAVLDGFTITGGNADGNYPHNQGGGIYNYSSSPTLALCNITGNAAGEGAGMYNEFASPTLTNCSFSGNTALRQGGGMYNVSTSPTLMNCSLVGNQAITGGGIYNENASPTLTNCIVWGNTTGQVNGGTAMVSYSVVQGGYTGDHNSTSDPLFVDADGSNLHLQPCSPAIDAGTSNGAPATDLDGNRRMVNNAVDIGAYEFQPGSLHVVYVDNNATGNNNGTSWTNAYTRLQDALTRASTCPYPTQIWVARGFYYPDEGSGMTNNDRSASFHLRNNVAIYGGFAGTETQLTQRDLSLNTTILSGDIDGDPTTGTGNAYHVVTAANVDHTAILNGVTIAGGMANGPTDRDKQGGGLYMSAASPRLYYCSFGANEATYGGAVYAASSLPSFSWCDFNGNTAGRGGALYNAVLSQLTVLSSSFSYNEATDGGAIYNEPQTSLQITNGRFFQNTATGPAEGPYKGGAIYNATAYNYLINCSFTANTASPSYGGALYNENSAPNITNTVLWDNSSEIDNDAGSTPVVSWSLVQGGYAGGTNILDRDPQFVNGPLGNLHLRGCSPAIDAGTQEGTYFADLDGRPRPMFNGVDLGAYEFQPGGPGGIVYVKGDATGRNDGSSWADAFTRLQDALAQAGTCKALEIWVATGTYYPTDISTDRMASFVLQNNVTVLGGFNGTESPQGPQLPRTNKSTLSGDIDRDGTPSGNAYHVVRSTGNDLTAVLDGFVITGGMADGGTAPDNTGAGIYLTNSSPVINRCTITGNTATDNGAGFYNDHSSPTISRCIISFNKALYGGGIYNFYSSPAIINSLFWKDTADYGGGLYNYYGSSPRVTNCTFVANGFSQYGEGIYNSYQAAPTITNTILWNNSSQIYTSTNSATKVSYSIVQGGYTAGTNILDVDPLFVNIAGGDFHLQKESPAINAGTPEGAPDVDLGGNSRGWMSIDIGAYEYVASSGSPGPLTLSCPQSFALPGDTTGCGAAVEFTGEHAATTSGGKAPVTITYTPASGSLLPVGENTIMVTASDAAGTTKTCSFTVTIVDAIPPLLGCPATAGIFIIEGKPLIKATDPGACTYTIKGTELDVQATDNCSEPLTYSYSFSGATNTTEPVMSHTLSGVVLNQGRTTITWMVQDAAGNTSTCHFDVLVVDKTAPVISNVTTTPSTLYPPNHQLQDITINYEATDNCEVTATTLSVTTNEAVNAPGDGNTSSDWQVVDAHHVRLRAERSGKGTDRIYTITITAKDAAGNESTATTTVTVPHDKGAPVTMNKAATGNEVSSLEVKAVPNPSSDGFTLTMQSLSDLPLSIKVMDASGRVIEQKERVAANNTLYIGSRYRPGVYYVQVVQGSVVQTIRLIKQTR